jgi:hypothetical protein
MADVGNNVEWNTLTLPNGLSWVGNGSIPITTRQAIILEPKKRFLLVRSTCRSFDPHLIGPTDF